MFVCLLLSFSSRGSDTNINPSLTETRLPALEQCVEDACPLDERVLRIREEREQFGREIERKEREIRERRARKKREREAREPEEASMWPQQQEAITGPWCVCADEGQEVSLVLSREDQCKYFDFLVVISIRRNVLDSQGSPSIACNKLFGGRELNNFVRVLISRKTFFLLSRSYSQFKGPFSHIQSHQQFFFFSPNARRSPAHSSGYPVNIFCTASQIAPQLIMHFKN